MKRPRAENKRRQRTPRARRPGAPRHARLTTLAATTALVLAHGACGFEPEPRSGGAERAAAAAAAGQAVAGTTAIRYLLDRTAGHAYHVVTVALDRPEVSIRTTRPAEGGRTTSSFAAAVGAAVAVNGDWSAPAGSQRPRGLSIGAGERWPGALDRADHTFIACRGARDCFIEPDFGAVTAAAPSVSSAVGGNDARLVHHGRLGAFSEHSTYTANTPRTAVGLSKDRKRLILVVADQDSSGGTRWTEVARAMLRYGAYEAIMLDGGGSSAMVVAGQRVNRLKNGASRERVRPNHLAVLVDANALPCAGAFCDDDGHPHEPSIDKIAAAGLTSGCAPAPRPRFCPDRVLTRGETAVFIARALALPAPRGDYFDDDSGTFYERAANQLWEARITTGTGWRQFSGARAATRGEVAAFLARALKLPAARGDHFDDDAGTFYEASANSLFEAGITRGCGTRRYCGARAATRGEMATLIARALRL